MDAGFDTGHVLIQKVWKPVNSTILFLPEFNLQTHKFQQQVATQLLKIG